MPAYTRYGKAINRRDGVELIRQDLATEILGGEKAHPREFVGFLTE